MPNKTQSYDVAAVGNAIVDVLTSCDVALLNTLGLTKGVMTLITQEESDRYYAAMMGTRLRSGGSGANTIAGIASFGGNCAYIGKVTDDEMGRTFKQDLQAIGVAFDTPFADAGSPPTARCMIFITPDADRTMQTYLGVSTELAPDDLDAEKIRNAKVTYLEGYLFDRDLAKEAFNAAAMMAHMAGKEVALTLSDPFCVNRHRADFMKLVHGHVDILFCNEDELRALYETDDIGTAMNKIAENVSICAVTQGAQGATILHDGKKIKIKAARVDKVIDTTGAGDLFAAGFLYGYTQGKTMEECGALAAMAAAQIISQIGARAETPLQQLLAA